MISLAQRLSICKGSIHNHKGHVLIYALCCEKFEENSWQCYNKITLWHLILPQIAKFMGLTWGPPGSCRPRMGPMMAPWTLLSGSFHFMWMQIILWCDGVSLGPCLRPITNIQRAMPVSHAGRNQSTMIVMEPYHGGTSGGNLWWNVAGFIS